MKTIKNMMILCFLFCSSAVFAQITIYVQHPWGNDPNRNDSLYIQSGETGWYPGTRMIDEGNGWFSYTFTSGDYSSTTSNQGFQVASFAGTQYNQWDNEEKFPGSQLALSSVFDGHTSENTAYIVATSLDLPPEIYFTPPESKVIYLLNPWPDNSPKIIMSENNRVFQMHLHDQMDENEDYCGWYSYHYVGDEDDLVFSFTDYFESELYLTEGFNMGNEFDLSDSLAGRDTIWIRPNPYPYGAADMTYEYPGRRGECPYRTISALVRDYAYDGVSFFGGELINQEVQEGIVQDTLGPNNKPLLSDNPPAEASGIESLESWFVGDEHDTCIELKLKKTFDGKWVYDSDEYGGFFPIDSFNPYNETYLGGIPPESNYEPHNFHFSMELHASFVYHQGSGQEFIFRGDDDVWVFINGRLAIDLGNIHDAWWPANRPGATDTVILDDEAAQLGLQDGEIYQIDMFYMERQPVGSNFYMNTSLNLSSEERLIIIPDTLNAENNEVQYTIKMIQKGPSAGNVCGVNILVDSIVETACDYFLKGPQFGADSAALNTGETNYGGILIADDSKSVTIDSAAITDLTYGTYNVVFYSRDNPELMGTIPFSVGGARPLIIRPDPSSGTTYKVDTSVTLSTFPSDKENIRLYYRISSDANLSATLNDIPYTYGDIIPITTLSNSDTTYLHVVSNETEDYQPDTATFFYLRRPQAATITADPSSGADFSGTLSITLYTNADSIYYTLDGTSPAAGETSTSSGKDTVTFDVTGDTVTVIATARGRFFTNTTDIFKYYSESLPNITAAPDDTLFTDSLSITLSIDYDGAEIYYTLDGSEPDSSGTPYTSGINIKQTTTIKAIAYDTTETKEPSPVFSKTYYRQAKVTDAFYQDTSGDGAVDRAVIICDTVPGLPADIILISPFDYNDSIVVTQSDMVYLNNDSSGIIYVSLPSQFEFTNTTAFPDTYGKIIDPGYSSREFNIRDKVAPVIISAVLLPGKVIETQPLELASDTLIIRFSEQLQTVPDGKPFIFKQNDTQYTLSLSVQESKNPSVYYNLISSDPENITPDSADTVWIDTTSRVTDLSGNIQDNYNNRRVLLEAHDRPSALKTTAVTKFSPLTTSIPTQYRGETIEGINFKHGTVLIADFSVPLEISDEKVRIKCEIYDALGSLVALYDEKNMNESNNLAADLLTQNTTKVVVAWNGRNRNNRIVADGTYLAVLSVYEPNSGWETKTFKLGVKK